jgi:GNAT superfamily N-acetyltransferase
MRFSLEILDGDAAAFQSLTFPRLATALTSLAPPYLAVGAYESGRPIGLALGLYNAANEARLLSVRVLPEHRRTGVGAALIDAWRTEGLARGVARFAASYSSRLPARTAFEATLRRARWPAPRLESLYMLGEAEPMASNSATWPAMRERIMDWHGIDFTPWRSPNSADRAAMARLSTQSSFIGSMKTTLYEDNLDLDVSLAVRRNDELVGWVLAQPVKRPPPSAPANHHSMYYPSAYIDEALAHKGLLIGGYYRAFRRQATAYGAASLAALHTAAPRMMRMVRRRFAPMALCVDEIYVSMIDVAADAAPSITGITLS